MENKPSFKKRLLRVLSYLLVAALASGVTFGLVVFFQVKDLSKLEYLKLVIDECFIDDYDEEAIEDAAASAMVDALGNPWSYYISASEYDSYMDNHANSYVGIGVVIVYTEELEGFEVIRVEIGGGAEKAGILPGDVITAIDGQSVKDLGVEQASLLVKGEPGTTVTVTVLRDGQTTDLPVERMQMEVVVATGQMLEDNIGLVKIKNFNERCAQETIAIVQDLVEQGAESLIFDVRFNPGGYKDEMVKVLDYLLPEGKLFCSVDYQGNEEVDRSDSKCLELPMAVLINGDSYSAAEFFAAALQEYEWATVVGTPSTGKSHFQVAIPLNDGSAVNLSVGEYFTPNGVSLADQGGLQPDVKVDLDEESYRKLYYEQLPYEEDLQLAAAVEVLKSGK